MINLISLTIDRLLAMNLPYFYDISIHAGHIYITVSIAWLLSAIYLIIHITARKTMTTSVTELLSNLSVTIIAGIGFVTLTISNLFIYIETIKQLRKIAHLSVESLDREHVKQNKHRCRELRLVRINVGMVATFILFWIPNLVTRYYYFDETVSMELKFAGGYLLLCNYICDPIIYISLCRNVKKAIKSIFKSKPEITSNS